MRRNLLIFLAALATLCTSFGQASRKQITITGTLLDAADQNTAVIGALVKLNASDTAKLSLPGRVVASDIDGKFTIKSAEPSTQLTITCLGYTQKVINVPMDGKDVDLGTITLSQTAAEINKVEVVAQAYIGKVVDDTLQFNAAAFKVNPDATTEDLLKKMPGVTTDESGNLSHQGETISKVYVNGKEYFSEDPAMALQSLPADAVESIQIYDDQSEDAKFSGFDDGTRLKTINIKVKKGVMNSTFGKAYAGYATDSRYSAGLGANFMTDNHRVVLTAQSNNVNNQGFSMNDIAGGGGMGRGMGRYGRGSVNNYGNFSTSANSGIRTTTNAGVNYSGEIKDKLKLSSNYRFSVVDGENVTTRMQDYMSMPRYYMDSSFTHGTQSNHSFYARAEYTPVETDRITFSPRVNYTVNHGNSGNMSATQNGKGGSLVNSTENAYGTKLNSYEVQGDLWWQHRFHKAGRVMSIGGNAYGQKSWGDRSQISRYGSGGSSGEWLLDSLDQIGLLDASRYTLTGSGTYTEPLSRRSRLSLNYMISYDRSISDQEGLNWDYLRQMYTIEDTSSTNYIVRNSTTQVAGLSYNYTLSRRFTLSATARYQNATLGNFQRVLTEPQTSSDQYNFSAVLPNVNIRFLPNNKHSLVLNYSTQSVFPSVTQLRDMWDLSNVTSISNGNPNLKQSYTHSARLNYNYNNIYKNIFFSASLSGTLTQDYIANHNYYTTEIQEIEGKTIPAGARVTLPTNLDGYKNFRTSMTFSFAIKPIKSRLNFMANYSYSQTPSVENFVEYMSNSHTISPMLMLVSNISSDVDFTVRYSPTLRNSTTDGATSRFDRYWNHDLSANFDIYLWKGFHVLAQCTWRNSYGSQDSYDNHYILLNAGIAQKFFNNRFEIKITGNDLLDQNTSLYQSMTDTYVQTSTSRVLKRYFMASVTWKFDTRNNKNSLSDQSARRSDRMNGMSGRGFF